MKPVVVFFLFFFFLFFMFTSVAMSESELEFLKRAMQDLQQKMEVLQQKIESLEEKANNDDEAMKAVIKEKQERDALLEKNKAKPVLAFWKNDFFLSTPDEEFWMKIRGNIHFDTKFYRRSSKNPSEFDIRRARLDFQGMFYKYISLYFVALICLVQIIGRIKTIGWILSHPFIKS